MAPDETSVFSVCSVAPETVSPTTPAEADSVSVPASVSADGVAPEAVSASSFRPVAPLAESALRLPLPAPAATMLPRSKRPSPKHPPRSPRGTRYKRG